MLARGVSSREEHSGERRPALGRSGAGGEHRPFALRAFDDLLRDSRFDNRAPPEAGNYLSPSYPWWASPTLGPPLPPLAFWIIHSPTQNGSNKLPVPVTCGDEITGYLFQPLRVSDSDRFHQRLRCLYAAWMDRPNSLGCTRGGTF